MYCYVNIDHCEIALIVFSSKNLLKKKLVLSKVKVSVSFPTGPQRLGLECLVNKTIVFLLALEIICIGPVSFPIENKELVANDAISKKLVFKQRFFTLGKFFSIFLQTLKSSFEPISIGFIFFLIRRDTTSKKKFYWNSFVQSFS